MAHRVTILALTLVLALPAVTAAQADPEQSDRERALSLFQESADHYRVGRFGVAAELLREAYDLHPEPLLLYNLGRALDGMGEFQEAIQAYRDYVEAVPDAEDRGAVERRIETLQTYLDSGSGGDTPPPPEGAPGATGPTYADSGPSPVPFVIAGVGAAGVGIGVVLGLMAQSRHDDAVAENVHVTAAEKAEEADNLAAGANIAFVAGGILLAVGVAWGVLELTGGGGGEQESLALELGPGNVGLRGTF
jgi:tetratricopeptide (TPR) repeat protein